MKRVLLFLFASVLAVSAQTAAPPFRLQTGDHVALIGDTFIEREQEYGCLESYLYAGFPSAHFSVRNLGWSGDTPAGKSRTSFDFATPEKGYERLTKELGQFKPTVAFIGYGMASSFDGPAGTNQFGAELTRLIGDLRKNAASPAPTIVLLSPLRHENMGSPFPDPLAHNQNLRLYSDVIERIARENGCRFISLFQLDRPGEKLLTDDGIHATEAGYGIIAEHIARQLGVPMGTAASDPRFADLRSTVVVKNRLFFYRWRPQNETYLLGFRAHEQGQNAKELPMFDPLVEEQEQAIAKIQETIANKDRALTVTMPAAPKSEIPPSHQEIPNFEMADGFQATLFAESPMIDKPIQINFDARGRLWVAGSSVYPQVKPGQTPDDKIIILEDTDGDGKADKSTIFADGLLTPTAVEIGDGGVYVGQSTELLFLKDTKGTGKADQRRVVLSGFGTEDTHHIVHTLRWGEDAHLYFDQSIYIHSHLETPTGVVRLNSGGIFRLRPASMDLEVFLKGFCNPWGHDFDRFGQSFVTDGAGFQGVSYGIPGATYFTYAEMHRELQSISPGNYPKFASLAIVQSPNFPDDWQGSMITCDFRAHRIVRFAVEEQGAGYVTRAMPDVMRSTNITFRPIDIKFGPDGALYVADWSNPIIQHGEVDFRDPRRDHDQGRIWRITYKGRPLVPRVNLEAMSTPDLLAQTLSNNRFNERVSKRVLVERGPANVSAALTRWSNGLKQDSEKLSALWLFEGLEMVNGSLVEELLHATDGRIRAGAARVLGLWQEKIPQSHAWLAALLKDSHPRARVEALRALSRLPSSENASLALGLVDAPVDPFVDYAVWLSINDMAAPWLKSVAQGDFHGGEKQLAYGLKALPPASVGVALDALRGRGELNFDKPAAWIELAGAAGTPKLLAELYQTADTNASIRAAAARALASASRVRGIKPATSTDSLGSWLETSDAGVRAAVIDLLGSGKMPASIALIRKSLDEYPASATVAMAALGEIGGVEALAAVRQLAQSAVNSEVRLRAVLQAITLNFNATKPDVLNLLAKGGTDREMETFWRESLKVKGFSESMSRSIPREGISAEALRAGLRVTRENVSQNGPLLASLERLSGNVNVVVPAGAPSIESILAAVKTADAAQGEKVFRRADLSCIRCHAIGGAGGRVGPDLTSIGASAQVDYLVESVFSPNAKIKEGYQSVIVETKDNELLNGIVVNENQETLMLRDALGGETAIPKRNIQSRNFGASLMPAGLIDSLPLTQQAALFRFLSELGKPGPFDASKGNVARLWRLFVMTTASEQNGAATTGSHPDFKNPAWRPVYTSVSGYLDHQDIEREWSKGGNNRPVAVYAGAQFQTSRHAPVRFTIENSDKMRLWIDGKEFSPKSAEIDLEQGKHQVVLQLDPLAIPAQVRVESSEGTFLTE